jgi:hypothetical protein
MDVLLQRVPHANDLAVDSLVILDRSRPEVTLLILAIGLAFVFYARWMIPTTVMNCGSISI